MPVHDERRLALEDVERGRLDAPRVLAWRRTGDPFALLACSAASARGGASDVARALVDEALRRGAGVEDVQLVAALLRLSVGDRAGADRVLDRVPRTRSWRALGSDPRAFVEYAHATDEALRRASRLLRLAIARASKDPPPLDHDALPHPGARWRITPSCRAPCAICRAPFDASLDVAARRARLDHASMGAQRVHVRVDDASWLRTLADDARTGGPSLAIVGCAVELCRPEIVELLPREIPTVFLDVPASPRAPAWSEAAAWLSGSLQRTRHLAGAHLALGPDALSRIEELVEIAAEVGLDELLVTADDAISGADAIDAIERALSVARPRGVRLRYAGLDSALRPAPLRRVEPPIADAAICEALERGVPLTIARGGLRSLSVGAHEGAAARSGDELRARAMRLAAVGHPVLDLPRCLGGAAVARDEARVSGQACLRCPIERDCPKLASELSSVARASLRPLPTWEGIAAGQRVLFVCDAGSDPALYGSTLPALARALRRRGVSVDVISPFDPLFQSDRPFEPSERARAAWLACYDVEGRIARTSYAAFDLVLTPEVEVARAILGSGSLRSDARLVLVDFHMLKGYPEWARAARAGTRRWWPSDRVSIWSAFPGYAQLYEAAGIPLEQIVWRPYSLHDGHFAPGGDVRRADRIFAGGNHLRDLDTLQAAAARLDPRVRSIDVYRADEGRMHGKLRTRGYVPLTEFYAAIASSRFVVVPLFDDPRRAAGITVAVMALNAGRPVVMTATTAARDYVRDGWNGLLVPAGDARALADAIERLDRDPALLATMSSNARRSATRFGVDDWADELVAGGTAIEPLHADDGWRWW